MTIEVKPEQPVLRFASLAERLLATRLQQIDVAGLLNGLPAEHRERLEQRLVEAFRGTADVMLLERGFAAKIPVHQQLCHAMRGIAAATRSADTRLWLRQPNRQFVCIGADGGMIEGMVVPALEGLTGQILEGGRAAAVEAPVRKPAFNAAIDPATPRFVCIPLSRPDGEVIGAMQVLGRTDGPYLPGDIAAAEAAVAYIAEIVVTAAPFAGSEEGVRLVKIDSGPTDQTQRDLILSKILAVALDILEADRGTVFLYDQSFHELVSRVAEGLAHHEVRGSADSGIIGSVFRSGDVANIEDAYQDPRFSPAIDWQLGYRTRSVLCVPIVGGSGERLGVVEILNKRGGIFGNSDERRLKVLASQIGMALENASLFEQILSMKSYNESILLSLSSGVLTVDMAGIVNFVNPSATRILRRETDRLLGRPLEEVFQGFDAWVTEALDDVASTFDEKQVTGSELYMEEADEWVPVNLTIVPLMDGKHTLLGFMLAIEDLTKEKELRRTMSRYMPSEVIDQLIADGDTAMGGKSQAVTVLFSDIRSFTALSESLGAPQTVSMLNEYFSYMEDVVTNRNGIIDKYIGDAIMALFGAPFRSENDAQNAVRAACDMLQALAMLNARRSMEGKEAIRIGVGIGTGAVITGNIGSPKRMDFTVIGDAVNLASRIESTTKAYGAQILICGTTFSQLREPTRSRKLDVVRVRGQSRVTELYEVLDYHNEESFPNLEQVVADYETGLASYLASDWAAALTAFERAVAGNPHDKASRVMAERCREYLERPPAGWDGASNLWG